MIVVNSISAKFQCGGCGASTLIEIDESTDIPNFWDLIDVVEDSVRGGGSLANSTSVQADIALCGTCTKLVDTIGDENYKPTADEINDKLAKEG